ncbi:MAG: glycine cleavage system protein GcvH [Thermoanaerobaculia bacterium]|nr:Glycine cleavage system H protein [Thermoanaerobaculia bacterium]MCK6681058.1 glycine cleavage system protein GcvH [Thermoanaerobaculia bacterium]
MSSCPDDRQYTKSHEWIRIEGDVATIGITDHAQKELGEVVFVDLPDAGELFDADQEFGTIESVKAVSELFLPVAGEILEINKNLNDEPGAINEDPYGEGWLVKIRVASGGEVEGLMSASQYEAFVQEEAKA